MSQGPSRKVTGSLGPEGPWWRSGPKGIRLPVLGVSRVLSEGDRPPYTQTWKPGPHSGTTRFAPYASPSPPPG